MKRMTAFGLLVTGLSGVTFSAVFVLLTNERFLQMTGAFAASLLCLLVGASRLRRYEVKERGVGRLELARASIAPVIAGIVIFGSGLSVSYWVGPTEHDFVEMENTRGAAFASCQLLHDGHIVGDVCRNRAGEDVFRLPPEPVDPTRDEEGD